MLDQNKRAALRQFLASLASSLVVFHGGACIGWTSSALPANMTDQETVAMVGASFCLATCLGNLLSPLLTRRLGQKRSLVVVGLPLLSLHWLLVALYRLASYTWIILLARAGGGLGFGLSLCLVPAYIHDISSPRLRGIFGLATPLMANLGILLIYVLGYLVDWWTTALVCLALTAPPLLLLIFTPDSPPCLLRRGKAEASREALRALEPHTDLDSKILQMEENIRSDQFKTSWLQTLKLLKKGGNFKPLLICMNLFLALHLCGMGPFIFFSSR